MTYTHTNKHVYTHTPNENSISIKRVINQSKLALFYTYDLVFKPNFYIISSSHPDN